MKITPNYTINLAANIRGGNADVVRQKREDDPASGQDVS
jgi:hypothetical protein